MADTFGILSLLLAIAGAAYLVWARVLRAKPQPAERVIVHDRSAETIPPTLRPQSEISPKMVAKQLAKGGQPSDPSDRGTRPNSKPPAVGAPEPFAKSPSVKPAKRSNPPPSVSVPPASARARVEVPVVTVGTSPSQGDMEAPPISIAPSSTRIADTSPKQPENEALPKLNVEEDEELEPTKIGAVVKTSAIQPVVEKIIFDEGADQPPPGPVPALAVYAVGGTDPGKRRKQNQDAFVCLPESSVFVVADGMGGHRGGQHASRLAVKTIGDAFSNKHFDAAAHPNIPIEASELARSIQMANTAIFEESKSSKDLEGMGTTLVATRFAEDKRRLYIGHVGDSRCYRIRDSGMKQITTDHTMADYGVTGPEGSHLSRALGVWPTVPIDLIMVEPKLGDVYLICSDGLTKMIPDGTIATQILHEEDPKTAINRLIFFANSHGGKDNITVLLVRIVEPGWTPPPAPT